MKHAPLHYHSRGHLHRQAHVPNDRDKQRAWHIGDDEPLDSYSRRHALPLIRMCLWHHDSLAQELRP